LKWIVSALGTPEDLARLGNINNEVLMRLAFRLINPHIRHREAQAKSSVSERTDLSQVDYDVQVEKVLSRVSEYCRNEKNSQNLKELLFGSNTGIERATESYKKWFEDFEKRHASRVQRVNMNKNLTEEFLLLSLADHKSALFNWMRASRAAETRERVASFRNELLRRRTWVTRQLGIEIVPSRHDLLVYLHRFLECVDYKEKPLQVRSIYDLEPTSVEKHAAAAERNSLRRMIYDPYISLVTSLNFSSRWVQRVRISVEIQDWMVQQVFQPAVFQNVRPIVLDKSKTAFLRWIVSVLGTPEDLARLGNINDEDLMRLAFRLINPHIRHREAQAKSSVSERTDLSQVAYDVQVEEVLSCVYEYCQKEQNSQNLKELFFSAKEHGMEKATESYKKWLEDFGKRHDAQTSEA
jgi:hypothetical protein